MKTHHHILFLIAIAALMSGCSTAPSFYLPPATLALASFQPPSAALPFETVDEGSIKQIDKAQRLHRQLLHAQADRQVEEGKVLYNDAQYMKAMEKFTTAEHLYKQVSASDSKILVKLHQVQTYLDYAYKRYAALLLSYVKEEMRLAQSDADDRFLNIAEKRLKAVLKFDPRRKREVRRLERDIRDLRDEIEIKIRTKPEHILKQLGDMARELEEKLKRRQEEWAKVRNVERRFLKELKRKEDEIQIAMDVYQRKRDAAGKLFSRNLVSACYPDFDWEKDRPEKGWTSRRGNGVGLSRADRRRLLEKAKEYEARAEQAEKMGYPDIARKHNGFAKTLSDLVRDVPDLAWPAQRLSLTQSTTRTYSPTLNLIPKSDVFSQASSRLYQPQQPSPLPTIKLPPARLSPTTIAKPVPSPPGSGISGVLLLPHFVDQARDTLKEIAEMYNSKKEWILKANPHIKSDVDLRKVKEIQVPVQELRDSPSAVLAASQVQRAELAKAREVAQKGSASLTNGNFKEAFKQLREAARRYSSLKNAPAQEVAQTTNALEFAHTRMMFNEHPEELWILAREGEAKAAKQAPKFRADLIAVDPVKETLVPMPLRHTRVSANISAFIAKVNVQQQFHNPFKKKIEAIYVFPLPHDAAVTDFIMTIGKRRIRGLIREKKEAEKIYKAAKEQGCAAALLTQHRPNIFKQRVANIDPGKQIDIDMTYFNTLPYRDGELEFSFPMVVGPRFNPQGNKDVPPSPNYLAPNTRSGHDISLNLKVDAGMQITAANSPTHKIDMNGLGTSKLAVSLKKNDSIPNKDFVFRYRLAGNKLRTSLLTQTINGQNYFAFMLVPPNDVQNIPRQKREMIFVLDCSGSMEGEPLKKSKAVIKYALRGLKADDTFQIIRFSESSFKMGEAPVPAKAENISKAIAFVDSLNSGGGTHMIEGIKAALDMPHADERVRIVTFLTDAYIGNDRQIINEIAKRLGDARVFSFGIGSSVNRYLISEMGRVGRGGSVVITPKEKPEQAVDAFCRKVAHSPLMNVDIDWQGARVSSTYPKLIPDLMVGEPVMIAGQFWGKLPTRVTVSGLVGGESQEYPVAITAANGHEGIKHVWARSKLSDLARQDAQDDKQSQKDVMIHVSTENSVLCQYTAFLAVDSLTKADGDVNSVQVSVPQPEK